MSLTVIAPKPMARRAGEAGADAEIDAAGRQLVERASALAVTGAMRFDGTSTPVPSRMREVCIAAAPMATKQSALSIWVS